MRGASEHDLRMTFLGPAFRRDEIISPSFLKMCGPSIQIGLRSGCDPESISSAMRTDGLQ